MSNICLAWEFVVVGGMLVPRYWSIGKKGGVSLSKKLSGTAASSTDRDVMAADGGCLTTHFKVGLKIALVVHFVSYDEKVHVVCPWI